jgi:hypothetical protein
MTSTKFIFRRFSSTNLKHLNSNNKMTGRDSFIKSSIRLLEFCAFAFPCLIALLTVLVFGVNVPYWDQWEYVSFFADLNRGELTFAKLFKQHLEYRQFFPNLIFVALGKISNWNTVWEMIFSWLIQLLTTFGLIFLAFKTVKLSAANLLLLCCLIFHPFQLENWMSGVQIVYFLGNLFVLLSIVAANGENQTFRRLLIVILCGCIATFSASNGILSFLLAGSLLTYRTTKSKRFAVVLSVATALIVSLLIYFTDYNKPQQHPDLMIAFKSIGRATIYFLSFLGRPFDGISFALEGGQQYFWHQIPCVYLCAAIGAGLFALYLENIVWWIRTASAAERKISSVWLVLGAYTIGTAMIVTIGRLGYGIQQSLSPRYVSFSLWLPVALLILFSVRANNKREKMKLALQFVIVASLIVGYGFLPAKARLYRQLRYQGKASAIFSKIAPNDSIVTTVYPSIGTLVERVRTLSSLGYISPPLIEDALLLKSGLKVNLNPAIPEGTGRIHSVDLSSSESVYVSGSSSIPSRQSPGGKRQSPDLIVFSIGQSRDDYSTDQIITSVLPEQNLVWLRYSNQPQNESRWIWKAAVARNINKLGWEQGWLKVWAYDVINNVLHPIGKPIELLPGKSEVLNTYSIVG